jgi:hypothetical protein
MGLFDEPDNEVYRLAKGGTLALLDTVHKADTRGTSALDAHKSQERPCDAVRAYLDESFLGPFLRSDNQIPYAENAAVLGTYVAFLDHELEKGASHATRLHQTHLKLLVYVAAIEAEAPLAVFGNGLEFLGGKRPSFSFDIYGGKPSANKKLEAVGHALKNVAAPAAFQDLYERLRQLVDPVLRNAIAHATYRIDSRDERVDFWNRGKLVMSRSFKEADTMYRDAGSYQQGFVAAVSEFARAIHPECPYVWHP